MQNVIQNIVPDLQKIAIVTRNIVCNEKKGGKCKQV